MKLLVFVVVLTLVAVAVANPIGHWQSTRVTGKVTCNGKPANDVALKLFDHDKFTADDKMGSTTTNADGTYSIQGRTSALLTIKPELHFKHSCGHITTHCYKIKIPQAYVTSGSSPSKTYEAAPIQLETVKSNC